MEEEVHTTEEKEDRSHVPIVVVVVLVLALAALFFFISTDREEAVAPVGEDVEEQEATVDFYEDLTTDEGNAENTSPALPAGEAGSGNEDDLQVN